MKNIAYITAGIALGATVFLSVVFLRNPDRKRRFNRIVRLKRQ
jgi:hypothetical protein